MGQPILPKWMHNGEKCVAVIKGQTYDGIIDKIGDYGKVRVKIAMPNGLGGAPVIGVYPKAVMYTSLRMRETHVPGLDEALNQRKGA